MSVQFDWLHGEADENGFPQPKRPPRRRHYLTVPIVVIVAVLLGAAALFVWSKAEKGLQAAQADVQAVVDAEADALRYGDEDVFLSMQDYGDRQWYRHQELFWDASQRAEDTSSVSPPDGLHVTEIDLRDDMAWAEVEYQLEGVPYRRAQFYRLVSGHWRRTAPPSSYWGERREATGECTQFEYHEAEETIILQIHGLLEDLCRQMIVDFAVGGLDQPITFELQPVTEASPAVYSEARILVPSPILLGVRADGTADEKLLSSLSQSIALLLAIERSGLYLREPGPGSSWVMMKGVVAWEVGDSLGSPALPEEWYRWLHDAHVRQELPLVSSLWPPYDLRTTRESGIAFAQAEKVVDYMVDLAGKAALPQLLDALGQKLSPSETISVVTGSTLDEFDRGLRIALNQNSY